MTVECIHAKSREQWLMLRRRDVTASVIGALVAPHPFVTPFELWLEKSGKLVADRQETRPMERGRELEPIALKRIQKEFPTATVISNFDFREIRYWRDSEQRIGATPDCMVVDPERGLGVVQIKSIDPSTFRRTWQPEGSNGPIDPPLWIALQALTEMRLAQANWAAVAVLRVGFGIDFDVIPIAPPDGVWQRLVAAVADFWRLVETGEPPPPDYGRDGKLIAALYPEDAGTTIDLSGDNEFIAAIAEHVQLRAELKQREVALDRLDAEIRHKAASAQRIIAGDWELTLKTENVKAYTVPARTRRPLRIRQRRNSAT
jgi:YqaJ-like viral recombinase domain